MALFVPCYVQAVLLPFGDHTIYDSLMAPYNIMFGKGIRSGLEQTYKDAKERGAIATSLLPRPVGPEERQASAHATNAQVLEAFRTHLFRSGLSPKVVDRDLAHVAAFADPYLINRPEPRSLRDFGSRDLQAYLAQVHAMTGLKEGQRRTVWTSFKRFVRFLRDTERMDYDTAEYVLEMLTGKA